MLTGSNICTNIYPQITQISHSKSRQKYMPFAALKDFLMLLWLDIQSEWLPTNKDLPSWTC